MCGLKVRAIGFCKLECLNIKTPRHRDLCFHCVSAILGSTCKCEARLARWLQSPYRTRSIISFIFKLLCFYTKRRKTTKNELKSLDNFDYVVINTSIGLGFSLSTPAGVRGLLSNEKNVFELKQVFPDFSLFAELKGRRPFVNPTRKLRIIKT